MTSFSEAGRIKCKYLFLRGGGRVNDPPLHFYGVGVGAFDDPLGEFDLDGQISPYPDPVDGMSGDTIPYKMNTTAERGAVAESSKIGQYYVLKSLLQNTILYIVKWEIWGCETVFIHPDRRPKLFSGFSEKTEKFSGKMLDK